MMKKTILILAVALTTVTASAAELLEGMHCGCRLRDPPRRALARPEDAPLDDDLDPEELLVVRTGRVNDLVDGS